MTEEIKYFIIGLIQGLAEFFPISSSGHIILFSHILDLADKHPLLLSITVHFATTLSTIIIYRDRIKKIFLGVIKYKKRQEIYFLYKIIVSAFPIILVGLLLKDKIDIMFEDADQLVLIMLLFTGMLLILSTTFRKNSKKITFFHAIMMGIAQAIAIIPGISRSGITIVMALFYKIKREDAAEFSFLMVLFPILGITLVELFFILNTEVSIDFITIKGLAIAFLASFVSGLIACYYMIKIVENNSLKYFGFYCLIIALIGIIL